jgi:hypothetical protein
VQEDFDLAKQLREAIDNLKSVGANLGKLEERKKIATADEDYDQAKILKIEMDKIKQTAYSPWIEDQISSITGIKNPIK